jgi:hypothetical protein
MTSSSPSLTLPGSLTLTSVVSAPKGGGVPTGKVSFNYDTNNALGSANLTILTKTQAIPAAPSTTFPFGAEPYPFWATSLFSAKETDLAISDLGQFGANQGPVLTIFPGLGRGGFNTSAPKVLSNLPNGTFIDAIASGDFKHDGKQEFLLHLSGRGSDSGGGIGEYDVVDSTLTDTSVTVPACSYYDVTCDIYDPDSETIIVDDFTGDGFDDIASLVSNYPALLNSYEDVGQVSQPRIRIASNNGNAKAVGFTFGPNATLPTFIDTVNKGATDLYCPTAIASGKFRAGGDEDVVSVGSQSTYIFDGEGYYTNQCQVPVAPGHLVLLLGDGKGNLNSQTPVLLGSNPAAVGVGDFNHDGKLDVVVADSVDNTVQVIYGNGDGTFATKTFTIAAGTAPNSLRVADFNGDGYLDVVISDTSDGQVYLLLNDRTGKFLSPVSVYAGAQEPLAILAQDMNGDGLPDLSALSSPVPPITIESAVSIGKAVPAEPAAPQGEVAVLLNSASAQAVFTTALQTLPAGSHTLAAAFPGDANFTSSLSAGTPVDVAQTMPTIIWQPPTAIEYGIPLGAAQLNATASVPGTFAYKPPAGTILTPGTSTLSVSFSPTDGFDYTAAAASVPITITAASLKSISPTSANLGSAAITLTVIGQGFTQGAIVKWNGSALATAYVNLNELTATVPASLFTSAGTATVTVADPASVAVNGSGTFTIVAPQAIAKASGPPTSDPGTQPSVQLTLNPYPANVTVTLTLTFTPTAPNQVGDPAVLFANGTLVDTFVVAPNSTAAITPISLQAGTTAGTITIVVQLTAGGSNITPSTLGPIIITVPPLPPIISSAKLTRTGQALLLVIDGLSSPRDMSQADFHFTAAPGATLKTTDLTVPVTDAFVTNWYQTAPSAAFGTSFQYSQPFTLDSSASDIGSVTITLTNSAGKSQSVTAQ